jgi:hypothetical protein
MMSLRNKRALEMVQAFILTVAGLLMALFPNRLFRPLPAWFGWLLFAIGILGFAISYWRYRKARDPWL